MSGADLKLHLLSQQANGVGRAAFGGAKGSVRVGVNGASGAGLTCTNRRQDVTTRGLEMLSSVARTPALWRVFAGLVFFGVWFLLFTELEHRMRTIEETNQYMGE